MFIYYIYMYIYYIYIYLYIIYTHTDTYTHGRDNGESEAMSPASPAAASPATGACLPPTSQPENTNKKDRKAQRFCSASHLAAIVPAVPVQAQLGAVHVRMRVGSVCSVRLWEWQAEVRRQGRLGTQRVLPAELLRRSGVQGAQQGRRRRRHGDRQVRGGEGQALRGRVTQVHGLLVLARRGGGGRAEVQGGGATVAVDDFGLSDHGAVDNRRGGWSQGRKAVSTAAL